MGTSVNLTTDQSLDSKPSSITLCGREFAHLDAVGQLNGHSHLCTSDGRVVFRVHREDDPVIRRGQVKLSIKGGVRIKVGSPVAPGSFHKKASRFRRPEKRPTHLAGHVFFPNGEIETIIDARKRILSEEKIKEMIKLAAG